MPRRIDHDTRRLEFAQAVWAVIAAQGIQAVTLRRVAAEAGASVGRLQHYYASRDDLIRDSCRLMIESAARSVDHEQGKRVASPARAASDLRTLLVAAIPGRAATRAGTAVWLAYLAASVEDPGIAALIADAERGAVRYAAALIAALLPADGDRRAASLGLELLSLSQGLAFRVLSGAIGAEDAVAIIDRRLEADGLAVPATQ